MASPGQAGVRPRKQREQSMRVKGVCVAGAGTWDRTDWLEGGVLGRKEAARMGLGARLEGPKGTNSIL